MRKIKKGDPFKNDEGKLKINLVPPDVIRAIAEVREYGINKYPKGGADGWKLVGEDRYVNALLRHALEIMDDPLSIDEESGLLHLAHIATNAGFLLTLIKEGKLK